VHYQKFTRYPFHMSKILNFGGYIFEKYSVITYPCSYGEAYPCGLTDRQT